MKRVIEKELLDSLHPNDARAIGSRRDLRRLNWWMGHSRMMAREMNGALNGVRLPSIVEVGAGDGEFMVSLARRLSSRLAGASLKLVDQQDTVARRTLSELGGLGWRTEAINADVFEWLSRELCATAIVRPSSPSLRPSPPGEGEFLAERKQNELQVSASDSSPQATAVCDDVEGSDSPPHDVIIANLFLHHFTEANLTEMLRGIARAARVFIALEPRRSRLALAAARQVWAIGCNHVTRHDAPASVRAGFAGKELSLLWPADADWHLEERPAGVFSHAFIARRRE